MEPRIVEKAGFVIAGAHHHGNTNKGELPALWEKWGPTLAAVSSAEPGVFFGALKNFDPATRTFDYLAAVALEPDAPTPEGFVHWEISAQTYAVFDTTLATLTDTIHQIHATWFPSSGYAHSGGTEFERYDADFDEQPEKPLTFWMPVVNASA